MSKDINEVTSEAMAQVLELFIDNGFDATALTTEAAMALGAKLGTVLGDLAIAARTAAVTMPTPLPPLGVELAAHAASDVKVE